MTELKLWKFSGDYWKYGDVEGLFIATEGEVDKFLDKRNVCFGEVLGKHSEVDVCFEKGKNLECLDVTLDTIEELFQTIGSRCLVGQDPFGRIYNALKCNNCGHEGLFTFSWWNPQQLSNPISCPECGSENYTVEE